MEANLKPLIPVRSIRVDEIREPTFVWYPYFPTRVATLIYGKGGVGKSTMCTDLIARITTGRAFPFSTQKQTPGNVLILTTEDEPEVTLGSRLRNAGADFSRIWVGEHQFTVEPRTIKELKNHIIRYKVTFVFLDPIVSYMGGKRDINKSNAVRDVMGELGFVARETDSTIIVVGHTRKANGEGTDADQAMGSADFINSVRSALIVDRTNDGTPIVRHAKSNYAKLGQAMTYGWDGDRFTWLEQLDDEQVLRVSGPQKTKAKDVASSFLKATLADGPVKATTILKRAADEGIAVTTLNRIKPSVAESFAMHDTSAKAVWYWRLHGDTREPKNKRGIDVFTSTLHFDDDAITAERTELLNALDPTGKSN